MSVENGRNLFDEVHGRSPAPSLARIFQTGGVGRGQVAYLAGNPGDLQAEARDVLATAKQDELTASEGL